MKSINLCPTISHFHIVFEQVGSFKRPCKTVSASSAAEALSEFLPTLPKGWCGGVSVFDDSINDPDEMPILHQYV